MGEELDTSPQEVKKTIKENFEMACPYFMAIGMTYDEFWYKDPLIAKSFLKAHEIRQKQENQRLWLQGYYNYIALAYISPILNPFAKKGTKPIPYPNQPIALTEDEVKERQEQERRDRLSKLKQKLIASANKNKEVIEK